MTRADRASMERLLASVARDVEPLLDGFVFVGGVTTGLMLTDPATPSVPVTDDVDVVVRVTTRAEYENLSERLRQLGLRHDSSEGAPICRWITPSAGIRLDVMPSEGGVLGFSNPWYDEVLRTPHEYRLEPDLTVKIVSPVCHLAAKWAAYGDRGIADPLASRDLEDIVFLLSGRPEIVEEVGRARPELQQWIAKATGRFLASPEVEYVLQGNLPDARTAPGVVEKVRHRLERIAALVP